MDSAVSFGPVTNTNKYLIERTHFVLWNAGSNFNINIDYDLYDLGL